MSSFPRNDSMKSARAGFLSLSFFLSQGCPIDRSQSLGCSTPTESIRRRSPGDLSGCGFRMSQVIRVHTGRINSTAKKKRSCSFRQLPGRRRSARQHKETKKKSFHSTRVPRKKVSGLAVPLVHSPLTPEIYVCGLGSSKITHWNL